MVLTSCVTVLSSLEALAVMDGSKANETAKILFTVGVEGIFLLIAILKKALGSLGLLSNGYR